MKIALFIILFSLITVSSYAQESQDSNLFINISASVEGSIELITIQSMDIRSADRQDRTIQINPISSSHAGNMVARGNPGSEFRLNYLETRELTNTLGTEIILFEYQVSGNTIDEQDTSEFLDREARELQFNEDGEFFIWVGGRVDLSNVSPGSYEGDFTIEIEYI